MGMGTGSRTSDIPSIPQPQEIGQDEALGLGTEMGDLGTPKTCYSPVGDRVGRGARDLGVLGGDSPRRGSQGPELT